MKKIEYVVGAEIGVGVLVAVDRMTGHLVPYDVETTGGPLGYARVFLSRGTRVVFDGQSGRCPVVETDEFVVERAQAVKVPDWFVPPEGAGATQVVADLTRAGWSPRAKVLLSPVQIRGILGFPPGWSVHHVFAMNDPNGIAVVVEAAEFEWQPPDVELPVVRGSGFDSRAQVDEHGQVWLRAEWADDVPADRLGADDAAEWAAGLVAEADSFEQAVQFALGAASVCWSESPRGVFESDRVLALAGELVAAAERFGAVR